ncbi:MAG: hypothetical protein P1U83_17225 [Roseovarius sp.]|nr:hypothetical protein [Roseovarius sp.]
MDNDTKKLFQRLRDSGLSDAAIKAAWPAWWTDEAKDDRSAQADLRFTLSRRLGVAPEPLLGDRVEFVWHDEARFKSLGHDGDIERSILTSFGISIGRLLIRATPSNPDFRAFAASEVRLAILSSQPFVDLPSLLSFCWGLGIPVVHLRVFPLAAKYMHAMVVQDGDRFAVLLGKDAKFPSPVAFTLAHELGHIALGHFADAPAIVDMDDHGQAVDDPDELEADAYALELLTGSSELSVTTNIDNFSARSLAAAVLEAGPPRGIEPGTLALCLAHRTGKWPVAMAALNHIYNKQRDVWSFVNGLALKQIQEERISSDSWSYLMNVLHDE